MIRKTCLQDYKIAQDESFEANLNKYNVLHVNMLDFLNRAQTVDGMIDYLAKEAFVGYQAGIRRCRLF